MPNVLIVTGSIRPGRVADKVLPLVKNELASRDGVEVQVADVKDLDLPFFDAEQPPSSPDFQVTDERVKAWTARVAAADAVLFLVPEYNHTMTAVQKNAIDWIYEEWNDKPVAFIGYGWVGGARAIETAKTVLANVKAKLLPTAATLRFMKELAVDGSVIDEPEVAASIEATVTELLAAIE